MKYITLFETSEAYNAATLDLPNVSLVEENMNVDFKPYVPETRVVTKYNITSTTSPTALRTSFEQNVFKSMEIDGTMLNELVTEYTFDTIGEHTIKYELYDETKLGNSAPVFMNNNLVECIIPDNVTSISSNTFVNCSSLTSVTIGNGITSIDGSLFYGCSGLKSVTIGNSVTSIGNRVFSGCGLTSVTIGNGVTSIGAGAFEGCSGLTNVNIPDSVTSIGNSAFGGCSGLTSIVIPESVTSIGEGAFNSCTSLTSINVNTGNTVYDSRDNCNAIIETETNTLICGCKTTIMPDSVTSISDYAFQGCSGLTSVTIGSGITSIGAKAFYGCSSLTNIVSNAITAPTITNNTFQKVKTGGTLTLPNGGIGYNVWMGTGDYYLGKYNWTTVEPPFSCKLTLNNGKTVELEGNGELTSNMISDYKSTLVRAEIRKSCISIGTGAFGNCTNLTSIIIPDSVISIDGWAFNYCTSLTSVTIPDSVTSIGECAFQGCSGLTSITIPDSVTSIGKSAFNSCNKLTSVTIGNGVTSIGDMSFFNCKGLTSIDIPNNVTSIGINAFNSCTSLTSIVIPESVISIGKYAFNSCTSLTSITVNADNTVYDSRDNCNAIIETETNTLAHGCKMTIIPDGVTSISDSAFSGCSGLTNVIIPDSVTNIDKNVFSGCSSLTSVTIGNGVTSIGNYAFNRCSSLTSIVSNVTTAPTITSITFYDVKTGGTLTVPNGSTGYDVWMGNYYLGKYNWTKVEQ